VAGDTFDFSVDRDTLHLSITDAMGHEVDAAMLATLLVNALRNAHVPAPGWSRRHSRGQRLPPIERNCRTPPA
jgi:hypothetical protein